MRKAIAGLEEGELGAMSNLTPRAQHVLALAGQEAIRPQHKFIGTQHVLLGLVRLGQGVAANVLDPMGINLESLRADIEEEVGIGSAPVTAGKGTHIPHTPRVKKVFMLAEKARRVLSHSNLGMEHILPGPLREGDGVAGRILKNLGVDPEQTHRLILDDLDPHFIDESEAAKASDAGESTPPGSRLNLPLETVSADQCSDSIELNKHYDVNCSERDNSVVVYRKVRFKGIKRRFPQRPLDMGSEFVEIELPNEQTVLLSRFSVIKFCEHGTGPGSEPV